MITVISKKIAEFLCSKNIIEKDKKEVYQYGYEVLVSGLTGFIIVLVLGLFMNRFVDSLLFLAVFVPVRQLTGGYHADSYLKCNIVFTAVYLIVMLVSETMKLEISLLYMGIMLVLYILAVYEYAPMENPDKPLDADQKRINRKTALAVSVILSVTAVIVYLFDQKTAIVMMMTLFSIACLLFYEKMKKTHIKK